MQTALEPPLAAHRRPAPLELIAAGLLAATVVLHVVAMMPAYFAGTGANSSLVSQPDQAALYAVLAASWALALVIGFTGPHRTPVAAALAAGVAAAELGFRVADLGDVFRYGTSTVGAGLWLMEAAWVVGAAAAVLALLAVRRRHGAPRPREATPDPGSAGGPADRQIDWTAPTHRSGAAEPPANPYDEPVGGHPFPSEPQPPGNATGPESRTEQQPPGEGAVPAPDPDPTVTAPVPAGGSDATTTLPVGDPTGVWDPAAASAAAASPVGPGEPPAASPAPGSGPPGSAQPDQDAHERAAWTMLVIVLALLVAGAFLPAWDHAVAYSPVTGQGLTRSLGNAFSGPWQQVVGTVLAAVAMAAVPIVAIRLRNRAAGAAAVCGALLVLGSQLTAAVIQVDQPVSPAQIGLSNGAAARLGLQLALKLTGWFTVDALAAFALFAAVMVWATLRVDHENSPGSRPNAPDFRRDRIAWPS